MKFLMYFTFSILCLMFITGNAQTTPAKTAPPQKKTTQPAAVKKQPVDPNKKAMNQYSKERMYNPAEAPAKPLSAQETKARDFYNAGAKKGKEGDFKGAIEDFTKSLEVVKNAGTYVKRGWAYQMTGGFALAIADADEALKMQPTLTRAYFVRGIARFGKGEYK